ncbi:hypothetical protein J132_04670 [Termitomyces sp. J132]|nr:hypothetical protein J132_04670 [Termitomyces sp. J132]
MRQVEWMHRTLLGRARTMRIDSKCLSSLWNKFYMTAAHLHAKMGTKSLGYKTTFELWHNQVIFPICMRLDAAPLS